MKNIKVLTVVTVLMFSSVSLNAQSISSLFSSSSSSTVSDVVTSVTGGLTATNSNIVGSWDYVSPAVELTSESTLSSIAGSVVSTQLEEQLDKYYSMVGISAGKFAFVFSSDDTFTSDIGSISLGGSYSVDGENGTIALSYKAVNTINIGTLTVYTTLTSNSLSMLFSADSLLKLLSAVASSSSSSQLDILSSLTEQYDGINLGFTLSGEVVTESSISTNVESAVNAISKFF